MSRAVTPSPAQPATLPAKVSQEKIAARAYEKWVKRGRPHGTDVQDWLEAEVELQTEMSRTAGATPTPARR